MTEKAEHLQTYPEPLLRCRFARSRTRFRRNAVIDTATTASSQSRACAPAFLSYFPYIQALNEVSADLEIVFPNTHHAPTTAT